MKTTVLAAAFALAGAGLILPSAADAASKVAVAMKPRVGFAGLLRKSSVVETPMEFARYSSGPTSVAG